MSETKELTAAERKRRYNSERQAKLWREQPEKMRAKARAYYVANKEKCLERSRRWAEKNREVLSERRKANKEQKNAYNRSWYANNRERERQRKRDREQAMRDVVLEHYGACCSLCGETDRVVLDVDHVNGGGGEHRRAVRSRRIEREVVREGFPATYRILCRNCNWREYIRRLKEE